MVAWFLPADEGKLIPRPSVYNFSTPSILLHGDVAISRDAAALRKGSETTDSGAQSKSNSFISGDCRHLFQNDEGREEDRRRRNISPSYVHIKLGCGFRLPLERGLPL